LKTIKFNKKGVGLVKQKLIIFIVTFFAFSSFNATADILVTNLQLNGTNVTGPGLSGFLTDAGDGFVTLRGTKVGTFDMDISQQTLFMDSSGP
jgi:hypothetical protein